MNLAQHYRTLGLRRGSSARDVKCAYRKLVRQYHPDINPDEAAIERFIQINDAYTAICEAIAEQAQQVAQRATQTAAVPDISPTATGLQAHLQANLNSRLDGKLVGLMKTLEKMGLGNFSDLENNGLENNGLDNNGMTEGSAAAVSGSVAPTIGYARPTYIVVEQPSAASAAAQTMAPDYPTAYRDPATEQRSLSTQEATLKQEAYEQLKDLLKQQKFPRAIALVEGLAHRMPSDSEIIQWQAIVYQRWGRKLIDSGQPQKARIYLKKALRTDPNNPSLWREINQDFWQLANL